MTAGRRFAAVAVAGLLAVTAAACSSDDDNDSEDVDTSVLGDKNEASGDPVPVMFISNGKGESVDTSDEFKAAVAAAEYANDYLGGINGRPLEVTVCETAQLGTGFTDCANQAVNNGAAAVLYASAAQVDLVIDVVEPVGIPVIGMASGTEKSITTPGVYSVGNGLGYFGAPAAFARDNDYDRAKQIVIDVPAALASAKEIGGLTFANAGVEMEVIGIAPGTPDMTPQITVANEDEPDMYHVTGDPDFCTSAIRAIKTVAPDAAITAIDRCIDPSDSQSIPGGYEGVEVISTLDPNTDTDEGEIFAAVLKEYGEGAAATSESGAGYASMLGFIRAMNDAQVTDYSPAGLIAAMNAATDVPLPLGDGITFTCDGTAVALGPGVCTPDALIGTADSDGHIAEYQRVESEGIYDLP